MKNKYVFEDDYLKAEGGFLGLTKNAQYVLGGVGLLIVAAIIYRIVKK
jgi:hypothetical protein